MKIAYDSQIFCAQTYGGVSRYICEIASRIAKDSETEVHITAPMHVNAYLENVPPAIVSGFRAPNMRYIQRILGTDYPRLMMRGLGLIMGDLMLRTMKPDIIHETYFSPYRLGPRHTRRVLTIYDMIHEKYASYFPHSDKTARYKAAAAERADHVICISESTRHDAIEILGLQSDKTSVIHLGFDLMNSEKTVANNVSLSTYEPFLLYVGNRGGYKNFIALLDAYGSSQQLKTNFKLICFGGGSFNIDELKKMQTLGLNANQVIQLGGDDHLLATLYEKARALIFPSLYEGFGIPPLEAMSHDCAVVCSNTSSIPEIVGDAGEFFDPTSIDDMREAIELVANTDSHRNVLIAKGRERIKLFSWDRCAIETLNVYRKLV